jgi:hypothetical protein
MSGFVKRVAADRLGGSRPSPARAIVTAATVGAAAAGFTYRLLRR